MNKLKSLFIITIALLISACNTIYVPPIDDYQPKNQPKVALVIDVSDELTHTHIGTTIFNNFTKQYEVDVKMKQHIFETLKKKLEEGANAEVVLLDSTLSNQRASSGFVFIKDKQWQFNPSLEAERNELTAKGIDVVISITETQTLVDMNCTQYGCTNFYAEGHGLYTRSFFGLDNYYAAASYDVSAEFISQPIDMGVMKSMLDLHSMHGRVTKLDLADPADHQSLDKAFFEPVQNGLTGYFENLGSIINKYLSGEFETSKKK
ncbi:hypothetical protein [Pseudoalteromonas luteoviolacea]|uniref:Lipoprotein n=1 Tax=Pseudoalteromonas luteoviolacea S4054 TaxID=1129367 RepID=A0A0F6AAW1_9GAMM|nr:hypothetical protein [Pseudoalteromonas luteoviolacea]AOT06840.1 hypothetical protein S4054249_02650 [Pseudoalteromonas luteoviolacea]AOT11758.1 hypothetical protein S40542_02650 [Pseudoalteromonas luteoviolacea]AOT16670.1 hypothetical protein S4054_02650 [Pseudoalteromonas luteoviolacea]KKE83332.1 hypothetical protein N479_14410 [Pseudoalteromonas luteoviolacea S4054]KZN74051.1 hypothetical protein N481_10075 [Pseudoalteromonas luteoviolacea S4047-1]